MPRRAGLAVLTVCLVVALGAYLWRSSLTRYFADDFCTASAVRSRGFTSMMREHRAKWSGRYAFYAVKAPLELIGPGTAQFTPGAVVLLTIAAALFLTGSYPNVRAGETTTGNKLTSRSAIRFLPGLILSFALIDAAPDQFDRYGPFVWETGAITYMLPPALFLIWLGLLARGRGTLAGAVLLLIAGGLSETSLAAQCAMTGAATIATLFFRDRRRIPVALAGLVASLVALAVVTSAPGNAVRTAGLPPRMPVPDAMLRAVELANQFVGHHLFVEGAALLLVAAAGILAGEAIPRRAAIAATAGFTFAYVVSFFPAIWTLSAPPPPRALYVATFFAALAIFAGFAAMSRPRLLRVAQFALIILVIVPLWSIVSVIRTQSEARREARNIDAILRLVEPQRGQDLLIRSRWAVESRYLGYDDTHPNNYCMSLYYELHSLHVTR